MLHPYSITQIPYGHQIDCPFSLAQPKHKCYTLITAAIDGFHRSHCIPLLLENVMRIVVFFDLHNIKND